MRELHHHNAVLLWLSTGHGKSVCYQVLPFLFDVKLKHAALPPSKQSACLVISPLLSYGGPSIEVKGSRYGICLLASGAEIKLGSYIIYFSAPEAILEAANWINVVTEEPLQSQVTAIAVDETYKWGTGFQMQTYMSSDLFCH